MSFRILFLLLVLGIGVTGDTANAVTWTSVHLFRPIALIASPNVVSSGWATFGVAVPQGANATSLSLVPFSTQVDTKNTWPSGAIRYAVITAKATTTGVHVITARAAASGTFTPTVPTATITFSAINGGGSSYTATLPGSVSSDKWLNGPNVIEWRQVVTPSLSGGADVPAMDQLQVLFDVRVYSDAATRLSMTVENPFNTASADKVTYTVTIVVNGTTVFTKSGVAHFYLCRWRQKVSISAGGGMPTLIPVTNQSQGFAYVAPDFTPFFTTRYFPRIVSTVPSDNIILSGFSTYRDALTSSNPGMALMGGGDLSGTMAAHGGRPEIAPVPDWVAQYIVHEADAGDATHSSGQDLFSYLVTQDEQFGNWPVHMRNPTGGDVMKITDDPMFWFDLPSNRADAGHGILGGGATEASLNASTGAGASGVARYTTGGENPNLPLWPEGSNGSAGSHQPSIGYASYIITGDRYFLEEIRFWAGFNISATYQNLGDDLRAGAYSDGSPGLSKSGDGVSVAGQTGGSGGITSLHPGSWGLSAAIFYAAPGGTQPSGDMKATTETRGTAWTLRNMAEAALAMPDSDSMRQYFIDITNHNLAWHDGWAPIYATRFGVEGAPNGFSFVGPYGGTAPRPEDDFAGAGSAWTWIALWEHAYFAWCSDRVVSINAVHNLFTANGGSAIRNRIVKFYVAWVNNIPNLTGPTTQLDPASTPYVFPLGSQSPAGSHAVTWFTSFQQIWDNIQLGNPVVNVSGGGILNGMTGNADLEHRLTTLIGKREGFGGGAAAFSSMNGSTPIATDIPLRPGWAITDPMY